MTPDAVMREAQVAERQGRTLAAGFARAMLAQAFGDAEAAEAAAEIDEDAARLAARFEAEQRIGG